ncbi:MAG: triose-phosphate isomerase [Gammaproteobacteria bacterium]|nr:triose-phosphate isomerase [Gammaproteobacteria bacterium]
MMRRSLIAGNWKMNGDRAMTAQWCARVARELGREYAADGVGKVAAAGGVADAGGAYFANANDDDAAEIAVCPPHILISAAVDALAGSCVGVGAQDLDANESGAFTGQTSARMLADGGCRYVIVGHSERRALYHESDQSAAQKAHTARAAGLCAILCVGETRAERDAGDTEKVLARQLDAFLDALCGDAPGYSAAPAGVVAYEPVWAIGSGRAATPQQAQAAHHFLRARIASRDARVAAQCRILYGGSVSGGNAAELLAQPDIDGALVGGASLKADDFLAICGAAS